MTGPLNAYILPGRVTDVREGLRQATEGERIGLSGIFVSERWETKEIASTIGALSQTTDSVRLTAGVTHFGTRHPLVLAGMGATLQTLTGGRFQMGFGRGVASEFQSLGVPVVGNAGMADFVRILRRLWNGETVTYDGPAGSYPAMRLGQPYADPPPLLLGAVGEKTLRLAGKHFDGVILHPFLTTTGVAKSAQIARQAAEDAGRDPSTITVYASVVTAPDILSGDQRADVLEARATSYFMHHAVGRPLATMNEWDPAPIEQLAATDLSQLEYSGGKIRDIRAQLAAASALLPRYWIESGAAVGSIDTCVARLTEYSDAGADQILLHGTTPDQHAAVVKAATDT